MRLFNSAPVNTNTLLPTHHIHVQPSEGSDQTAIQLPASAERAREIGPLTKEQDLAKRTGEIRASLHAMFGPHIKDHDREAMEAMIEVRAKRLAEEGEDGKMFDYVMRKGANWGHAPRIMKGMLFSGSFAGNSLSQDFAPPLKKITKSPLTDSVIKSAISASSDLVSGAALKRATSNLEWLVAEEHQLEPVMQRAAQVVKPSVARQAIEAIVAFQTPFLTRNISRIAIQAAVTATYGAETAALVDAVISGAGSLLCGAAAYEIQHAIDKRMHRAGPEYLMGRTDWHERYTELKNYGITDAAGGLVRRGARLPLELARDTLPAVRSAVTPGGLATMSVLTAGLVGIGESARLATSSAVKAGWSPTAVAAAGKAAVAGSMAVVIPAWVTTAVAGQHLADKASAMLDRHLDRPEHIDQTQGMVPIADGPTAELEAEETDDDSFYDAHESLSEADNASRSSLNQAERMV